MSKSTSKDDIVRTLRSHLALSLLKKSRKHSESNSVSCAVSRNGGWYIGGKVESDTNLLDFSSEQVALLKAVQHRDFDIAEVITLSDGGSDISPLTLKVLVDFGKRVGKIPMYKVVDRSGKWLYRINDVASVIPFYKPAQQRIVFSAHTPEKNWRPVKSKNAEVLKAHALQGLGLAFPTYAGASSYGAAVITETKKIYFAGQYSAPDKRLGIHAEMSVIISALMAGEKNITHLGVISDKFKDEPCTLCGCCRQFIAELSRKFNWNIRIYCFAKDKLFHTAYTIGSLLPHSWSSKKW